MPVCLHCGEIGDDGALFCAKCGYTLPQDGPGTSGTAPAGVGPASGGPPPPYPPTPPRAAAGPAFPLPPAGAGGAAVTLAPGASRPNPPPSAKYCARCGTLISRAAVFCPVCQQPQP